MSNTVIVEKVLSSTAETSVTAESGNTPFLVDPYSDIGIYIKVTGATVGDVISVNMTGGLAADAMATVALEQMPMQLTITADPTSKLFTLNLRGMSFLQILSLQTTRAGCTVTVYRGGARRAS